MFKQYSNGHHEQDSTWLDSKPLTDVSGSLSLKIINVYSRTDTKERSLHFFFFSFFEEKINIAPKINQPGHCICICSYTDHFVHGCVKLSMRLKFFSTHYSSGAGCSKHG